MSDHDVKAHMEHAPAHFAGHKYYSELIRIVSMLFVGVLALMTFLLTVGYQRPHAAFSWALYTALISLALNLVAYVVGHMMMVRHMMLDPMAAAAPKESKSEDKDESDKPVSATSTKSKWEMSKRNLMMMRLVQQVLFVIAVLAVTWLAVETANFFFSIPTTPTGGATPQ